MIYDFTFMIYDFTFMIYDFTFMILGLRINNIPTGMYRSVENAMISTFFASRMGCIHNRMQRRYFDISYRAIITTGL